MTTPTPSAMREDLNELLNALPGAQGRAIRAAIIREVFALFDTATAKPAPATQPSDTNGSNPAEVERALFLEPHPAELRIMEAASVPNGFEHRAV